MVKEVIDLDLPPGEEVEPVTVVSEKPEEKVDVVEELFTRPTEDGDVEVVKRKVTTITTTQKVTEIVDDIEEEEETLPEDERDLGLPHENILLKFMDSLPERQQAQSVEVAIDVTQVKEETTKELKPAEKIPSEAEVIPTAVVEVPEKEEKIPEHLPEVISPAEVKPEEAEEYPAAFIRPSDDSSVGV